MARPNWADYFMRSAYLIATRATCDRKHVGAVIVTQDNRVVASGYNGSPAGTPSCDEVGHELSAGHCVRTIHAEANAISFAGRTAQGCTLYTTVIPCYDCCKLVVNAGIQRVVYDEFYPSRYGKSDQVVDFFKAAGLEVVQHDSVMLEAFKKKLKELEELENSVLSTMLVEYACGCSVPAPKALLRCAEHGTKRVRE